MKIFLIIAIIILIVAYIIWLLVRKPKPIPMVENKLPPPPPLERTERKSARQIIRESPSVQIGDYSNSEIFRELEKRRKKLRETPISKQNIDNSDNIVHRSHLIDGDWKTEFWGDDTYLAQNTELTHREESSFSGGDFGGGGAGGSYDDSGSSDSSSSSDSGSND